MLLSGLLTVSSAHILDHPGRPDQKRNQPQWTGPHTSVNSQENVPTELPTAQSGGNILTDEVPSS